MKCYLGGPMRGIEEFNFPAFLKAARWLREQGHIVFNPAERDIAVYGDTFSEGNLTGDEIEATKKFGFSLREALAADMEWICKNADAIVLLPGWEASAGARTELALADTLSLDVWYMERSLSAMRAR